MKVIIDTSSLIALVRYYLPFDNENVLYDFFQNKIESKELVVLDKVFEECRYTAKSIVVNKLAYLKESGNHIKTSDLLPNNKFFNQIENQFCYGSQKNRLNEIEFENQKNEYLKSADIKIVLYALTLKIKDKPQFFEEFFIVTEETRTENDNKLFKKLPEICDILQLTTKTLPKLLKFYNDSGEINFSIIKPHT